VGVVFVIFDQQHAQRDCGCWLAFDLIRLIWGTHRMVGIEEGQFTAGD
jgi:hypothetical protein